MVAISKYGRATIRLDKNGTVDHDKNEYVHDDMALRILVATLGSYHFIVIPGLEICDCSLCDMPTCMCTPLICRRYMKDDSTIRLTADDNKCIDISNYGTEDGSNIW